MVCSERYAIQRLECFGHTILGPKRIRGIVRDKVIPACVLASFAFVTSVSMLSECLSGTVGDYPSYLITCSSCRLACFALPATHCHDVVVVSFRLDNNTTTEPDR
jgi:hypothetical protein